MKNSGSSFGFRKQTERYFNVIGIVHNRARRVVYHSFFRSWFQTSYEVVDRYRLVKRAKVSLSDRKDIVWPTCQEKLQSQMEYENHVSKAHPAQIYEKVIIKCKLCDRSFSDLAEFMSHKATHKTPQAPVAPQEPAPILQQPASLPPVAAKPPVDPPAEIPKVPEVVQPSLPPVAAEPPIDPPAEIPKVAEVVEPTLPTEVYTTIVDTPQEPPQPAEIVTKPNIATPQIVPQAMISSLDAQCTICGNIMKKKSFKRHMDRVHKGAIAEPITRESMIPPTQTVNPVLVSTQDSLKQPMEPITLIPATTKAKEAVLPPKPATIQEPQTATTANRLVCDICQASFAKISELITHKISCEAKTQNKFAWESCSQSFDTISSMITHQITHEKQNADTAEPAKPVEVPAVKTGIKWENCGQEFEKISLVINHQLQCNKAAGTSSPAVSQTATNATNNAPSETLLQNPQSCTPSVTSTDKAQEKQTDWFWFPCKRGFKAEQYLNSHIASAHEDDPQICLICLKEFQNIAKVKQHFPAVHPKEYGTSKIDLLFKSKSKTSTDPNTSAEETPTTPSVTLSSLTSTIASAVEQELPAKDRTKKSKPNPPIDENMSVDDLPLDFSAYTTADPAEVDPVISSAASEVFEID